MRDLLVPGTSGSLAIRGRLVEAGAACLVLLTMALIVVGGARSIGLAFLPLGAVLFAVALWSAPLRITLFVLLAVGLVVDDPMERPAAGHWRSPLYPIGSVLFDNLNNVVHVPALRFSGLDALLVAMVLLVAVRLATGDRRDSAGQTPGAPVMAAALLVAFAAIAGLELWGLARGGHFKNSLWQVRQLMWTPVLALLFLHGLRGAADLPALARIVVVAASAKAMLGLYFLLAVARPLAIDPAYVTSHGDSVLFVAAIAICVSLLVHLPRLSTLVLNATVVPLLLVAISINNRRLAFVSLAGALLLIYLLLQGRMKRTMTRLLVAFLPLFVVYLAIAAHRPTGVFAPGAAIVSIVEQSDASSATRDIENYNLLVTLKQAMLLGSGFGHEYIEASRAYDVSQVFALYRYVGHNGVLWLWTIGGLVGFTAIWLMLTTGIFLATRAYRCARGGGDRAAAASLLGVMVAYVVQAWGDMGTQSWTSVLLLAAALAGSAGLAVATGGWPARRAGAQGVHT